MRMDIWGSRLEREFHASSRAFRHKRDKTEDALVGGSSLQLPFEMVLSTLDTTASQRMSPVLMQFFWREIRNNLELEKPR